MQALSGHRPRNTYLIYMLFALASIFCARSIFYVNVSQIDIPKYEAGTERMPFQGRVAMIPVLRWAHSNPAMVQIAAILDRTLRKSTDMQNPPEGWTAEKLISMIVGVVSVCAMTAASLWFGHRRLSELWWVPGVLTLAILLTTYSARYEWPFWYPYDLPHFAIFGIAGLLVLEGMLLPAMLLFAIDVPVRETSIYLLPIVLAVGYSQDRLRQAITASAFMVALWLPVHVWINHFYALNPRDTVFWHRFFKLISNPLHWPQIASAFGFLALPVYLGRQYLRRNQRFFILGALPCLLTTLIFGIWNETRIWDDWTVPVATMLATEFVVRFRPQAVTELPEAAGVLETAH